MKSKQILKKLHQTHAKYTDVLNSIEKIIQDKVDFECYIIYQESDGFNLLNEEDIENAPLDKCLEVIDEKGRLTLEDYKKYRI